MFFGRISSCIATTHETAYALSKAAMLTIRTAGITTIVHRTNALGVCLCLALIASCMQRAFADESNTPLAGEQYHTEVLGKPVDIPLRDRRNVTAINFGVLWIPNGPSFLEVLPFGSLYLWRNWPECSTM